MELLDMTSLRYDQIIIDIKDYVFHHHIESDTAFACARVALLDAMGIDSVKHLKYTVPMLIETLARPLGSGSLQMLKGAVEGLKAVIRNGWPRMTGWRGEVLKGLCFCWVNLGDGVEVEQLRGQLKEVLKMLQVALSADPNVDLREDVAVLAAADARLAPLFAELEDHS